MANPETRRVRPGRALSHNDSHAMPTAQSRPWADFATRFLPLTIGLVAALIYALTCARTVTWAHSGADSGDLVAAAFTFGIPHPPGYPLFTILAGLVAHLPYLEPAGWVSLLAALFGGIALFIIAKAGAALLGDQFENPLVRLVPPFAALTFAFSPALWSQATIAEVYTLNLALAALMLWAMVSNHTLRLDVAAAALGLGLAHHLSIVLLVPGAWLMLRPTRRDWRAALFVLAPLLLYAYLPLRAATHPPVNWGNPSTLDGLLWEVTAAPYRSYLLNESAVDVLGRIQYTARLLFDQFTVVGVALALWGLVRLVERRPRLALALGLNALLVTGYSILYSSVDSFVYLLPVLGIMTLWLCYGAADVVELLRPGWRWVVVVVLGAIALYNLGMNYASMDLSGDRAAHDFARGVMDSAPPNAVVLADGDEQLFALTYYRYVLASTRSGVLIVSPSLLQFDWYYSELDYRMTEFALAAARIRPGSGERVRQIVSLARSAGRAVCFTPSSSLLSGYQYETRGDLKCITSR